MAVRAQFENSNEYVLPLPFPPAKPCVNSVHRVGVFATLTNAYAVVAIGASENFYRSVMSSSLNALGRGEVSFPLKDMVEGSGHGSGSALGGLHGKRLTEGLQCV